MTLQSGMTSNTDILYFSRNKEGRDFIVGDIHGCFTLLEQKLLEIKFDCEVDRLFSVGDLVDRGTQSHLAVRWLQKPWFHAVLGNHEMLAIQFADVAFDHYRYEQNGGQWFMDLAKEDQVCVASAFATLMPTIIEIESKTGLTVGIVHAECPISDWGEIKKRAGEWDFVNRCIWGRSRITYKDQITITGIDKVYHGHTVVTEPVTLGNRRYIDTGAVFTGVLTIEEIT